MLLIRVRLAGVWTRGLGCRCSTAAPMWRYRLFAFCASSGYVEEKDDLGVRGRRAGAKLPVRVLPGEWLEMAGKPSRGLVVGAGGGTRGGGRMVGEGSAWKVGNPRACIVAADGLPLSMVPMGGIRVYYRRGSNLWSWAVL